MIAPSARDRRVTISQACMTRSRREVKRIDLTLLSRTLERPKFSEPRSAHFFRKKFLHSHCPWGPANPLTPLSHFSPSAEKNPLSANFKGGLPPPTLFFPLKISILRERTRAGGPLREEPLFSFPLLVQKPFPRLFLPSNLGGGGKRGQQMGGEI